MLATSASAACFAVPSVTAANLAALILGASHQHTPAAGRSASAREEGSAGRAGDQKAVGCTFKPVTTHNAL
jgi:hypothetical protein